jgi:hypothetical protein
MAPSAWLKWDGDEGHADTVHCCRVIPSLVQVQEAVDNANPLFQAPEFACGKG